MDEKLYALIEATKSVTMTGEEIEKQMESFAFGNTQFGNSRISKEIIAEAAHKLKQNGEL